MSKRKPKVTLGPRFSRYDIARMNRAIREAKEYMLNFGKPPRHYHPAVTDAPDQR